MGSDYCCEEFVNYLYLIVVCGIIYSCHEENCVSYTVLF